MNCYATDILQPMEVKDAIRKAALILTEERRQPTTKYKDLGLDWSQMATLVKQGAYDSASIYAKMRSQTIAEMRDDRRVVSETPERYKFESVNFELLLLMGQIHESDRAEFVSALLHYAGNVVRHAQAFFPNFEGYVSDLPLIAEFAIRSGHTELLFEAIGQVTDPSHGIAVMLMQLEETVALNFTQFSEYDYERFPDWLGGLREMAQLQTHSARVTTAGRRIENPKYKPGKEKVAAGIVTSIDNLFREMKQAQYMYLKGSLQQAPNLEVENDWAKVESFLDKLGFNPLLTATLKKADDLYNAPSDSFDLKSCIGLIRSFLEYLHIHAGKAIAEKTGKTATIEWDPITTFLRNNEFLTKQQEKFARGLYALLSDEGVHPLIAEREFARLSRNMCIEYGLMFPTMFEKSRAAPAHLKIK